MKAIIAAAGTGGHINPGIAIANEIKRQEPNSKIIFVGTNRGLENDLVPRAGYELKTINAYGFDRKISFDNLKRVLKTIYSIKESKKIISEFKPDIVIGTGGYICIPIALAAKSKKIPIVLHESNAFPGMAVKLLSAKSNSIFVGFEDAKKRLPKAKNVILTGTPTKVKKLQINDVKRNEILVKYGLNNNLPIVLAFGGSQGAQSINNSLIEIILQEKNKNYQLIWAAGPSQYDDMKKVLIDNNKNIDNLKNVKIVPYIYNMEEVLNVVDLVVCRSGAMTITEIANVGKPAIFMPYPFATENHQEYNAKVLEQVGAARIILDKNLNSNILNNEICDMVANREKLIEMGNKASIIAVKNVEETIYKEIKNIVDNNK